MSDRKPRRMSWVMLALTALFAAPAAHAVDAADLKLQTLAATCAQCHGTDGKPLQGSAMVRLAGAPKEQTLATLMAFRSGQRPATIMHQITRGYSPEQLAALADYFSKQK